MVAFIQFADFKAELGVTTSRDTFINDNTEFVDEKESVVVTT